MQRFNQPLYYASVLNKSPTCERYRTEVLKVGFNNYESKRTLEVFEDFAYLLWNTDPSDDYIRRRMLFGILKRRNFKFTQEKANPEGHVIVTFFNLLVQFYAGVGSVFPEIVACIDINPLYECYDFKWRRA